MSSAEVAQKHYTYRDYLTWNDGQRYEIIDGVVYCMSPAPTPDHQRLVLLLGSQLADWLSDKSCEAFVSPIDVRLSNATDELDDDVIVQPDVLVICDPAKVESKSVRGAPDFVIEISSPSTARHDELRKTAVYERSGVREYWIIRIEERLISRRVLENGRFSTPTSIAAFGKIPVGILPGFEFDFGPAPEEQTTSPFVPAPSL